MGKMNKRISSIQPMTPLPLNVMAVAPVPLLFNFARKRGHQYGGWSKIKKTVVMLSLGGKTKDPGSGLLMKMGIILKLKAKIVIK